MQLIKLFCLALAGLVAASPVQKELAERQNQKIRISMPSLTGALVQDATNTIPSAPR